MELEVSLHLFGPVCDLIYLKNILERRVKAQPTVWFMDALFFFGFVDFHVNICTLPPCGLIGLL
jgi:hypothetical protein